MALRPVEFQWNEKGRSLTGKEEGKREIGFIAQEVQEVAPQFVAGNETSKDEDGNPVTGADFRARGESGPPFCDSRGHGRRPY
jgi:hypothetical protein